MKPLFVIEKLSPGLWNKERLYVLPHKNDANSVTFSFDGKTPICNHKTDKAKFVERFNGVESRQLCDHKDCEKEHNKTFKLIGVSFLKRLPANLVLSILFEHLNQFGYMDGLLFALIGNDISPEDVGKYFEESLTPLRTYKAKPLQQPPRPFWKIAMIAEHLLFILDSEKVVELVAWYAKSYPDAAKRSERENIDHVVYTIWDTISSLVLLVKPAKLLHEKAHAAFKSVPENASIFTESNEPSIADLGAHIARRHYKSLLFDKTEDELFDGMVIRDNDEMVVSDAEKKLKILEVSHFYRSQKDFYVKDLAYLRSLVHQCIETVYAVFLNCISENRLLEYDANRVITINECIKCGQSSFVSLFSGDVRLLPYTLTFLLKHVGYGSGKSDIIYRADSEELANLFFKMVNNFSVMVKLREGTAIVSKYPEGSLIRFHQFFQKIADPDPDYNRYKQYYRTKKDFLRLSLDRARNPKIFSERKFGNDLGNYAIKIETARNMSYNALYHAGLVSLTRQDDMYLAQIGDNWDELEKTKVEFLDAKGSVSYFGQFHVSSSSSSMHVRVRVEPNAEYHQKRFGDVEEKEEEQTKKKKKINKQFLVAKQPELPRKSTIKAYDILPDSFADDISAITLENPFYRRVIFTSQHLQTIVQRLNVGEDIDMEKHDDMEQTIHVVSGHAFLTFDFSQKHLYSGFMAVIPRQEYHRIKNASKSEPLLFYTMYTKADHPKDLVQQNKYDLPHEGYIVLHGEDGKLALNKFASLNDVKLVSVKQRRSWFFKHNTNSIFDALIDQNVFDSRLSASKQIKAIEAFVNTQK